ncbi:MAG: dihydroorotate dehydrogenase [Atopobiaceae bacterium]|jgi:dihydroorotate dehydrogenase (NAD+) catalytic subunit|nr:dihydroorotate dehydrogenase [Atopobiaceae bacterium]MDD4380641.1 dihydroorotate dehydrogenase [Atopobiaceae bacterium]
MAVDLGGIKMQNPVGTASGTFGFGWQFEGFYDVAQLGSITLKGCSPEPWEGNPSPRMCEVPSGVMNSVGLMNPGVAGLIDEDGEYLERLSRRGCAVICQAVGHSINEYVKAVDLFEERAPFAAGIEINISCPNIDEGGAAMGATPEGAAKVVAAVRDHTTRPLLVKLAPARVPEVAHAVEDAGADAISLINTIPAMSIDVNTRRSRVSRPTAGLSGPAIHAIAVRMVWEAASATSLPINAMGGITSGADAAEFILAGATCVSVGTSNLVDPPSGPRILEELTDWVSSQGVESVSELVGAFEC